MQKLKTLAKVAAVVLAFGISSARADDEGDEAGGDGADPATKTLPESASDTAKANAFGQQGDRMKAAHEAARAAAADAARQAAHEHATGQPASPGRSAESTSNRGEAGRAHAAAASAAGRARAVQAQAAHPPKGPKQ